MQISSYKIEPLHDSQDQWKAVIVGDVEAINAVEELIDNINDSNNKED